MMKLSDTEILLSQNMVDAFARFSRDVNPLHLDESYARKTPFSTPICYGGLAAMAMLAKVEGIEHLKLTSLKAEFLSAVRIGCNYTLRCQALSDDKSRIQLFDADSLLLECQLNYVGHIQHHIRESASDNEYGTDVEDVPVLVNAEQINTGDEFNIDYQPRWTVLSELCEQLKMPMTVALTNVAAVMAFSSYWIGMRLPGQQALFSGFNATFTESFLKCPIECLTGSSRVVSLEREFDLINQEIMLSHDGVRFVNAELRALFRPVSSLPDFSRLTAAAEFGSALAGKNILITGASRGLGACLTSACLLAGATVYGVYHKSVAGMQQLAAVLPESVRHRLVPVQGDCSHPQTYSDLTGELAANQQNIDYVFFSATPALHSMDLNRGNQTAFSEYLDRSFQMLLTPLTELASFFSEQAKLIFISTVAVEHPVAAWPHYVAAKSGMESLIASLVLKPNARQWYVVRLPQMRTDLVYAMGNQQRLLAPEQAALSVLTALQTIEPEAGCYALIDRFEQSAVAHIGNLPPTSTLPESGVMTIASSFTLDPIAEAMDIWLTNTRLNDACQRSLQLHLAPYGQVVQTCLAPDSPFYRQTSIANVLLLRLEDAVHYRDDDESDNNDISSALTQAVDQYVGQCCEAISQYHGHAPLFVWLCRDSASWEQMPGYASFRQRFSERLTQTCHGLASVYFRIMDHNSPPPDDELRNEMAHIPYLDHHYADISRAIIRQLCAVRFSPKKVIVCDCDNTLWSGVVGEDGVDGIILDAGHLALQARLVSMVEQGFLVCLCSKNNSEDVEAVFAGRKDMVLQRRHITGERVNWQPKSDNIRSLATELNLGLDSFVFLDDNPVEILEVEQNLEGVLCVRIPASDQIIDLLDRFWFADRLTVTEEDRRRTEMYQGQVQRQQIKSTKSSLLEYIQALDIELDIQPLTLAAVPRVSQLSNKTNQFNLTTLRLDESAVRDYCDDANKACWTVQVRDKFGDYGLVGALFAHRADSTLYLDNLLLSCRVLGRGVEYSLLKYLGESDVLPASNVMIRYRPSAKNVPALEFLQRLFPQAGFTAQQDGDFELTRDALRMVQMQDVTADDESSAPVSKNPLVSTTSVLAENRFYQWLLTATPGQLSSVSSHTLETSDSPMKPAAVTSTVPTPAADIWPRLKTVIEDTVVNLDGPVNENTPFDRLSLSSLMMVNLTVALSREFACKFSSTYLFGLKTLTDLLTKIRRDLADQHADTGVTIAATVTPEPLIPQPTSRPVVASKNTVAPDDRVAIIGIAGRYPGAANVDQLWQLLLEGRCCIGDIPEQRWDHRELYVPEQTGSGQSYSNSAGMIDDVDKFDTTLFNISPKDARLMDPQQRWFLTIAYECLLSAGYNRETIARDTGVFAGAMAKDYQSLCAGLVAEGKVPFPYADLYQIANRVSYFMDLSGPSITIDTACSSSGVALHMACEAIRKGECSQALAGGVNLILHPQRHIQYSQMQMLSKDGLCRSFSDQASGMVMGEGVGCVLLKPLAQALLDGDQVYATLLSSHVNSGGRTSGFTVPNPLAQAELIRSALNKTAIDKDSISYIEAHGTGTPLGDPIEVEGIASALNREQSTAAPCFVGSIKSNIGHLEPAAAIAGLTKVVLQFQHKMLVPSLHAETLNHRIEFDQYRIDVPRTLTPWTSDKHPRRAGVSSFGAGGVNAHIVLEEYETDQQLSRLEATGPSEQLIIPLSAQSEAALTTMIRELHEHLLRYENDLSLPAIAYTLQTGRDEFRYRAAFMAASVTQLVSQLSAWVDMKNHDNQCVCADIKDYQNVADIFSDCDILVQQWLSQGNIRKIADIWVKGASLNWHRGWRIHEQPHGAPVRIRLPGYPFMGTRQWVEGARWQSSRPPQHPEVANDAIPLSVSDYFVADHVVDHQCILPGVSYLAALESRLRHEVQPGRSFALKQMLWMRPLSFSVQAQQTLHISALENGYVLTDSAATVYARCRLDDSVSATPASINPENLMHTFASALDHDQCYQRLIQQGFHYGPGLQCVEWIRYNDHQVLGYLTRRSATGTEPWALCSALLDAGLQTTIIFNQAAQTLLPFACDRVVFCETRWPDSVYSLATIQQAGNERMTCDIGFYDEQGRALLMLQGLTLLAGKSAQSQGADFYGPVWQAVACQTDADPVTSDTDVLILTDEGKLPVELPASLSGATVQVLSSSDINRLTERQLQHSQRLVIDLISAGQSFENHLPLLDIYRQFPVNTRYLVVWEDRNEVTQNALGESYAGLSRALMHETDQFQLQTLRLQHLADFPKVLTELLSAPGAISFRYSDNQLECLRWQALAPVPSPVPSGTAVGFESGGVYWLTGSGGVARALAGQLQQRYQATVILSGRREAALVQAEPLPENVLYMQGDINVWSDCQAIRQQILDRFGKLDGIIHTAGTVHDERLMQQRADDFTAVLQAKINGARHLSQFTRQPSDPWLILCSSIAAVVGNIGQTSYAMANAWLDAMARHSVNKRIMSINWPLWRDTGMAAGAAHLVDHNQRLGFGYLQADDGLNILEQAIQHAGIDGQVVYLPGDEQKIQQAMNASLAPFWKAVSGQPVASAQTEVLDQADVAQQLLQRLFDHTNELLELPEGVLEADEDLSSYGFDSISLSDFADRLNAEFDLGISPVLFFDHPTLSGLASALLERFGEQISRCLAVPQSQAQTLTTITESVRRPEFSEAVSQTLVPTENPPLASTSSESHSVTETVSEAATAMTSTSASRDDIAVIGLSCRFPGADSPEQFWQNICDGRDLVSAVPEARFASGHKQHYAGLVEELEHFDPEFFKITGREAILMDPQHRLLMELSWQAIEHAGYHPKNLSHSRTGVFIGITLHDHLQRLYQSGQPPVSHLATGNVHCLAANRISYLFNFNGPSEAVDTACSSSLVALNRAVKAMRDGECDTALVGGANALLSDVMFNAFSEAGMLSKTGKCHTFSAHADGYVRGEGGGMVLLKPLSQAIAANDHIHAIIKGTAVNHGGHGQSLTAPSASAQARVIRQALEDARVSPSAIGYIEAHGTGTQLGDPIELEGLRQVYGGAPMQPPAYIGTVKTNIGHLESAAGMAGLIKVIMALKAQWLPKSLHGQPVNKLVNPAEQPFTFLPDGTAWQARVDEQQHPLPLRAGVSSFGFGGVNAHVIVEQAAAPTVITETPVGNQLVLVSAVTETLLRAQLTELQALIPTLKDADLPALALTSRHGRGGYRYRAAYVVSSLAQLSDAIGRTLAADSLGSGESHIARHDDASVDLKTLVQMADWQLLAARWQAGENIHWPDIEEPGAYRKMPFPLTRFNRRPCTISQLQPAVAGIVNPTPLQGDIRFFAPVWQPQTLTASVSNSRKTVLLLVPETEVLAWSTRMDDRVAHDWYVIRFAGLMPRLSKRELEIDVWAEQAFDDLLAMCAERHLQPDWIVDVCDFGPDSDSQWQARIRFLQLCVRAWSRSGLALFQISDRQSSRTRQWFTALYAGLAAEYRQISCRSVVFDQAPPFTELEPLLERELQGGDSRPVSICDGQRQILSYQLCNLPQAGQIRGLDSEAAYLVTGGLGGLGLQAATLLRQLGAKHLILLGRRQPDETRSQQLQMLSNGSAQIEYFHDLSTLAERLQQQPVRIAGVIHCAGIDTQGELAFVNKPVSAFTDCLAPKVVLAEQLVSRLTPHLDPAALTFFIAFSSVSTVVPALTAGRSDYGPANAALDQWVATMAGQYPQSGFVSVQWPSHQQGGMPVVVSDVYRDTGLANLTREQSDDILKILITLALQGRLSHSTLLPHVGDGSPVLFSKDVFEPAIKVPGEIPRPDSKGHHEAAARTLILTRLTALFARQLLVDESALQAGVPFDELGIDSILIADLVRAIESEFDCILPPSAILEYPSLGQLTEYLGELVEIDMPDTPAEPQVSSTSQTSARTIAATATTRVPGADNGEDKVAVIGMACRFPGAESVTRFWHNLEQGICSVTEVPEQRFDMGRIYAPVQQPGKSISKWGGFIDGVDLFDPEYFSIPQEQAAYIDPLTRLSLMVATEAIADAGYTREDIWGRRCGVYMGGNRGHYGLNHVDQAATATGLNQNFIAAHLAHIFNLTGPCYVMDAACASSLLSVHSAVRDLLHGDVDLALAGGVEVLLDETPYLKLSAAGALSPDGLCQTFSRHANGFVPGEGAGTVVLKRLSQAQQDGDSIYAVIEASEVNNDGHTMGLTTPNIEAQKALLERVYGHRNDVSGHLRYIEAHGTGTMIGDPIELKAMASVFAGLNIPTAQVAVGSVKSNLGHLMGAAGIASFIKTALIVKHRRIPPTLHCDEPNPRFNFSTSPLVPANIASDLRGSGQPLLAGISAFGFGGTNCHICLSNDYVAAAATRKPQPAPQFNLRSFWLKGKNAPVVGRTENTGETASKITQANTILELEWL
ncbi:SDR family NAD(P)-dependent oxidoreductase [Gynuella sunshinyii]|uniref:PKS n=1 Tax=Gynuella sunshinyii YC6258 TaxID=1445510 RepID=A0A0C5VNB2_9GAMM|nr:SDR family NAD(P)-dependent oxidoreductase [Gynuella sunshinyii]AJQ95776.1 polyketide synthase modules-related protein [Gynuella sunshinyii YC6258]DAC80061.1 TPA_exp: PKS [Gynuella sunshinyii YC6258]